MTTRTQERSRAAVWNGRSIGSGKRFLTSLSIRLPMAVMLFWMGSAVTEAGTIAFIDINDAQGVPAGPDTNGNFWNSTATELDTVALVDTSNGATGWTLDTQENPVASDTGLSGNLNNTVVPPAPYNIQQAYADSWFDSNSGAASGKGQFSFSGLTSGHDYELKLFGARPSGAATGTVEFTVGSATGGPSFTLTPGVLLTISAQPNGSGVLTFTFNELSGSTADLNLMSIEEFISATPAPEPSTFFLATLGVLGLLGWGRRRRR